MLLFPSLSDMPLLFLTFMAIAFFPGQKPVLANDDQVLYTNCTTTFQCGSISGLGYPFWGSTRPSYCGHPGFRLECSGEVTLMTIMQLTYQLLAVNSSSHTITVARTDYMQDVCPSRLANTTLNPSLFSYTSDTLNITLFYGCPLISSAHATRFSCSMNATNSTGYYVTVDPTNSSLLETSLASCNNRVVIPAHLSAIQAIEGNKTETSLMTEISWGFGLQYRTANDSLCKACEDSGGLCGYNQTATAFTCYCRDQPYESSTCVIKGRGSKKALSGIVVGKIFGIIVIVLLGCCCLKRLIMKGVSLYREKSEENCKMEMFIKNCHSLTQKRYSYSRIEKITNSFKEKLGQGGFGDVYKGKLPDGRLVAVKLLHESKGDQEDFLNEVSSISGTSHVNVVAFLGFCYERSKRALIYEYMPNGSLDNFICGDGGLAKTIILHLEWKILYQIAVGIARGLEYLHRGLSSRIVHFDIKPHNILLDEDFCPKISDFGLAKLCKRKESMLSILEARGTVGYIAPEVFLRRFGAVSYKSDVYSYGMMMLEMVGANKIIDAGVGAHTSEMYFPDRIYEHLEQGELNRLLDEDITQGEEETARKMIIVGLWCIQTSPSDRPTMTSVVEMLEGSLQSLHIPPKPFLFSPTTLPDQHYSSTTASAPYTETQEKGLSSYIDELIIASY